MHVISSFENSVFLELALNKLQETGVKKGDIVAVPLETISPPRKLFDTIHRADGYSLLDLAAVLATIFSILGATFGFELKWGPIVWGLLGLGFGALLGFIVDYLMTKKRVQTQKRKGPNPEVVLIIKCEETEFVKIKEILLEHQVIGIGKLKSGARTPSN